MEIVKSTRGGKKIGYKGFIYRKDREGMTKISWRCEIKDCKGRLSTPKNFEEGDTALETTPHGHAPDPGKIAVLKVRDQALEAASTSHDPPRRILQRCSHGLTEETATRIGSGTNIKQALTRKRKREGGHPRQPVSAEDMEIPHDLTITHTGENFLLFDSGYGDRSRLVIFGTRESLEWLRQNRHWLADGTFKVAPAIFMQLYVIHAVVQSTAVPCIYALMKNKDEATYQRLFDQLKTLCPPLDPTTVLTDFEVASRNAFSRAFPGASLGGCFFHLGQSIYRKIVDEGLRESYISNEQFRTYIKMMSATAFLPADQVIDGFQALCTSEGYDGTLDPIFDYFENNYIGRPLANNRRRLARFPIESWNAFSRLEQNVPRTNNAAEGWHFAFQNSISSSHPNMWVFIEALRSEESLQRARYHGLIGGEVPRRGKKYITMERRIDRIVSSRQERTIIEYLRGIAYNITIG